MASFVEIFYRQHLDVVAENFRSFLENETYIDLIFVCANNRKVGAHQIVMGCLSKFLFTLLIQNQMETKDKVIYIYVPDIKAKIMRHILQFVYTGKAFVNREDLGEFNDNLMLLGMPLSALTSVDQGQSSMALVTPSSITPTTPITPLFQPPEIRPNVPTPTSQNIIPTSGSDPNFAISNVGSLSNPNFSSPNRFSNVTNPSSYLSPSDRMLPTSTMPSNTPGITPPIQTSTFGARISAEVITGSNQPTETAVSTSKTSNKKTAPKSEPKAEKRRLSNSGSARKSLKFDQYINLVESDDDSDVISIT